MSKLKRELKTIHLFAIAAGAMISSGLFILPGIAYKYSGPAVVFAYILAGLFYLPALFCNAELSTAMPKAGGTYFYIDRSLGGAAGAMGGMAFWLSDSLKSAFALVGIGASLEFLIPGITEPQIKIIAIIGCLIFMALNIVSVKHSGGFQVYLVGSLLLILAYYIILGFNHIEPSHFKPFFKEGLGGLFYTVGIVFISFGGVTKVVSLAEEADNPVRNVPLGMFLAFGVMMFIYAMVVFVTVGITPGDTLSGSLTPIVDAADFVAGKIGFALITIAAMLAFITTANAGLMSASRATWAMSRDEHMPRILGEINKKFDTPVNAILFTGMFMILSIVFLDLENLVKTASAMQIFLFVLVLMSVIILRESGIHNYKPVYHSPFYPYFHILGILIYIALLATIGGKPLLISGIILFASLVWYIIFSTVKKNKESALDHVIDRLSRPESYTLAKLDLGQELKEIVHERDDVIEDFFDVLVMNSTVVELEWRIPLTGFMGKIARAISNKLDLDENEVYETLIQTETSSPSYLRPGLVVPSLETSNVKKPHLFIIRNIHGIEYSPVLPPVYAVFIMIYPKSESRMYLQTLSAIVEITQDDMFDEDWFNAGTPQQIRNVVLMKKRRRIYDVYCTYIQGLLYELNISIETIEEKFKTMEECCNKPEESALYGLPRLKGFEYCKFFIDFEKYDQ
ncbi:MAG: amino acid permease [Vulcanimicrobiota bacterium]